MISGFAWQVPARIVRWLDGDTCEAELDLGWRIARHREKIRLLNLWAPELSEPGGPEATLHAHELAPPGTIVTLTSKAIGKLTVWGSPQESLSRTLADIRLPDGRDFATTMVLAGHGTHTEEN